MDKKLIKWGQEISNSVELAIQRIEGKSLSNKDHALTLEICGDLIEELKQNENDKEIEGLFTKIQTELEEPDVEKINITGLKYLQQEITDKLYEAEKINHITDALQLDAQSIMPLEEQIREKREEVRTSFQKAVDLDVKIYGSVSEITIRAMEAYHFDIDKNMNVVAVQTEKVAADIKAVKEPEQRLSEDVKEYLSIPPQGKEQFSKTVQYFKENGARFDPFVKHWYITPQHNRDMFKTFLSKDSVIGKIEKKKNDVKEQSGEAKLSHARQNEQIV